MAHLDIYFEPVISLLQEFLLHLTVYQVRLCKLVAITVQLGTESGCGIDTGLLGSIDFELIIDKQREVFIDTVSIYLLSIILMIVILNLLLCKVLSVDDHQIRVIILRPGKHT